MEAVENKRNTERFELDLLVKVIIDVNKKPKIETLHTRDISSEGTYLRTDSPIEPGTPIKLELFLSMDRLLSLIGEKKQIKVKVNGEVIRTDSIGMAIRFDKGYKITPLNKQGQG